MSATLYDSEDNLENGTSCDLEMNVHGFLFLTSYENPHEGVATCTFSPDEKGFSEAEKLAAALLEWVRHAKESSP